MTRRVLLAGKKAAAVAVDRIGSRCFGVFPRESLPKRTNADVDEPFLGTLRFIIPRPPPNSQIETRATHGQSRRGRSRTERIIPALCRGPWSFGIGSRERRQRINFTFAYLREIYSLVVGSVCSQFGFPPPPGLIVGIFAKMLRNGTGIFVRGSDNNSDFLLAEEVPKRLREFILNRFNAVENMTHLEHYHDHTHTLLQSLTF